MPDKDQFATAVKNNPDGWGMSAATGEDLEYSFSSFQDDAWKNDVDGAWAAAEEYIDSTRALHLRYTTAGATDIFNAHPHIVSEVMQGAPSSISLCHNGTISSYRPAATSKDKSSDTTKFVENFIEPLFDATMKAYPKDKPWEFAWVRDIISSQAGSMNRLLFLDNTGEHYIHAEDKGKWLDDGIWVANEYSFNASHRDSIRSNVYGYQGGASSFLGKSQVKQKDTNKPKTSTKTTQNKTGSGGKSKTGSRRLVDTGMFPETSFCQSAGISTKDLLYFDSETVYTIITNCPDDATEMFMELQAETARMAIALDKLQRLQESSEPTRKEGKAA